MACGQQGFGHGAEPVASVYRHLFPELVRPEDLVEAAATKGSFMGFPIAGFGAVRFEGAEIAMRSTSPT